MGLSSLPEKKKWVKRTREGDKTGASAGADLVSVDTTYQSKLTRLEVSGDRGGFFNVVVRERDRSSPTTRMSFRMPSGGGELHRKGTFEDPIMNWDAYRTLAVQNVISAGAGEKQQASITFWELSPG